MFTLGDNQIHLVWMQDKKQPACWLYIFVSSLLAPNICIIEITRLTTKQTRFFALAYYIFDASQCLDICSVLNPTYH